jgi:hypothetical protein
MKQSLLTAELTRFFPEEDSRYLTNYTMCYYKVRWSLVDGSSLVLKIERNVNFVIEVERVVYLILSMVGA